MSEFLGLLWQQRNSTANPQSISRRRGGTSRVEKKQELYPAFVFPAGISQTDYFFQCRTHNPAGIWCQNDVASTSMRRDHVASTSTQRHFGTKCPLGYESYTERHSQSDLYLVNLSSKTYGFEDKLTKY